MESAKLFSQDVVWRFAGVPAPFNKESFTGFLQAFCTAFPDMQHNLDPQIAERDASSLP